MEIRRVISKYKNENDSLISDYNIDHIPVAKLREILNVKADDPDALKVYRIDNAQLIKFIEYVPDLLGKETDLGTVEFFYESFSS